MKTFCEVSDEYEIVVESAEVEKGGRSALLFFRDGSSCSFKTPREAEEYILKRYKKKLIGRR